jgi:nitrite reductase/ring-hydroxylating ferredoxin subunit
MEAEAWIDVGSADELQRRPLHQVLLGRTRIALVCKDGEFSAISGDCNHVGGTLGAAALCRGNRKGHGLDTREGPQATDMRQ